MTLKKPACYSAIGSLGFHLVFVLVAGSFWLSQAEIPPIEKSFRLKVVSRPPPPPVVKKKSKPIKALKRRMVPVIKPMPMPKTQRKRETVKIARVQKMVAPSVVPVAAPRASKPLDNLKSAQTKIQRVTSPQETMNAVATMAPPRTFKPSDNAVTNTNKMVRMARVQGGGAMFATALSSPRSFKPANNIRTGSGKIARVMQVQGSETLFGVALSAPRSFHSSGNVGRSSGKATRMARVRGRGSGVLVGNGFSAPRALQSFEGIGSQGVGRKVARVQKEGVLARPGTMSPHALKSLGPVRTDMGKDGRVARADKGLERVHSSQLGGPRALPNIVDSGAARGYLAGIRRKIASTREYPREAKNAGQEGKVRVRFTILEDGQVRDLMLVSSTRYATLNNEALEMVRRAAPFSHLPKNIGASFLKVVLPFTFQLN